MKLSLRAVLPPVIVLGVLLAIPVAMLAYQSHRTGQTWSQVVSRMLHRTTRSTGLEGLARDTLPKGERIDFLRPVAIGDGITEPPRICHVLAVDLDQDGLLDVLVCDAERNIVSWIRQESRGVFVEHVLAEGLIAPAHVQAVDFTGDGHLDIMVAVLGMLFPNNDKIGSVVILENNGDMTFTPHLVLDRVARVADVRAADLNGNGRMDLAVAHFGYDDGEIRWMENLGDWQFRSHILQTLSGPINVEVTDLTGNGHLDLVALVSQEWEEIYVFVNDGKGNFTPRLIYGSSNEDFGSSGISLVDLNQDGRMDILFTNGDAFDYIPPRPRPWHGVQWLENLGDLNFRFRRIGDFHGAYNARAVDFNGNGHLDVIACSAFNLWEDEDSQSLIWLENDGNMQFTPRDIANTPTHILALDVGDFTGNGQLDVITGGMHVYPPYDRMGRIVLWVNEWVGEQERP